MQELTDKEREQMNSLRWRRADNGKYFSAFDNKEDAFLCLKEVSQRYKYTSLHDNTLADLCKEYQDKGIMLYPTQLGKWMKNVFDVNVRYTGWGRPQNKIATTFTLDNGLKNDYLDQLKRDDIQTISMSEFVNEVLRVFVGMQHDSVIVFLTEQEKTIPVMFYLYKDEIQALFFSKVQQQTKKIVQLLSDIGEDEGMLGIQQRSKRMGYYVL